MIGAVVDLSLAHTNEEVVVLGAEDSLGNLFVHNVMEGSSDLFIERVVVGGNAAPADLVSLSEHVTEEKEPDKSVAKLLVLTHVAQAEVCSLSLGVEEHEPGSGGCRAWPAQDLGCWWRCRGWVRTCHSQWGWLGQV